MAATSERITRREALRRLAMLAGGAMTLPASAAPEPAPGGLILFAGEALGAYGFPEGHPLGVDRQGAFLAEARASGVLARAQAREGRDASGAELRRFHSQAHIEKVQHAERDGLAFLDNGDTPVFPSVFRAASSVVGAALAGLASIMGNECARTFQPVGGLHHAGRDHAAGFCVFSDLGVAIETLRAEHGVRRIGYVDIDVHHGDGVFYAYESDPELIFADIHEDGRALYPGTGREDETGRGAAKGRKLNIPMQPGSGDDAFAQAWPRVEAHLARFEPEIILFQCGADGLKGDPLAHLRYTPASHALAARGLRKLADRYCHGRLMAFGGGGYDRRNLAKAWTAVMRELV